MPDSNPFYELLGGYYPGDPIQRKRPYGKYTRPIEFNADKLINAYLYAVDKQLDKLNVPKVVKKKILGDAERALVAQTKPSDITYDPMRALELGDEEDVAGMQVKLDINPVKWVKDPIGMAKKTGQTWVNDFFNWEDFSSYSELENLWNPLLQGRETSAVAEFAYGEHIENVPVTKFKPFQLQGLDKHSHTTSSLKFKVTEDGKDGEKVVETKVDLFGQTAGNFKNFARSARASGSRNSSFRKYVNSAGLAASSELIRAVTDGVGPDGSQKVTDPSQVRDVLSFAHRAKVLRYANAITGRADMANYEFTQDKDSEFYGLGEGFGIGIGIRNSDLSKYILGTERADRLEGTTEGKTAVNELIAKGKTREDAIKEYRANHQSKQLNNFFYGEGSQLNKAKKSVEEARAHFRSVGAKELNEFNTFVRPFERYLQELEGLGGSNKKIVIKNRLDATILKGKIDEIHERFAREGPIKGGLDNMNRKFLEQHLVHGDVRKIIFDPKNTEIVGTKNLLTVSDEVLRFYKREDFYDLISQLEKDGITGILSDQLWNLARKRLGELTPQSWINERLKRVHHFGLIYNQDYATDDSGFGGEAAHKGSKFMNTMMSTGPLKKLFENKQSFNIKVGEKEKRITVKGHRSLFAADKIFSTHQEDIDKAIKAGNFSKISLIKLLNFDESTLESIGYQTEAVRKGFETLDDYKKRLKEFRNWLREHNDQLGLTFDSNGNILDSKENTLILVALLGTINNRERKADFISLFQDKAGLLQKVSSKLNILQTTLFKSKIGKFLAPVAYVRELAAKTASKAVRKTLEALLKKVVGGAIAAGTGVGAVLIPIIDKITQYVVKKTVDFAAATLKAIKEADFDIVEEFMEKSGEAFVKVSSSLLVVYLVLAAILTYFISFILTSLTPVDPTRMSFYLEDSITMENYVSYGTELCPVGQCPEASSVDCFSFVGDWPTNALSIIEDSAEYLVQNGGSMVENLCAGWDNRIEVAWLGDGVACGRATHAGQMQFGTGACYPYDEYYQATFNWLFAHEASHMYHFQDEAAITAKIKEAIRNDCDHTLPTYRGDNRIECSLTMHHILPSDGLYEDFAETLSNFIAYHRGCPATETITDWQTFIQTANPGCPGGFDDHYNLAVEIFYANSSPPGDTSEVPPDEVIE